MRARSPGNDAGPLQAEASQELVRDLVAQERCRVGGNRTEHDRAEAAVERERALLLEHLCGAPERGGINVSA